jgi:hypothetical protein
MPGVFKLCVLHLHRWLDLEVGAYGEDAAERHELVAVALERVSPIRLHTFDLVRG